MRPSTAETITKGNAMDWRNDPLLRAAVLPANDMHWVVRYGYETAFAATIAAAQELGRQMQDRQGRTQGVTPLVVGPFPGKPEDQLVPAWETD